MCVCVEVGWGWGGCATETKHVNTIYVFNKFGDKLGFPSNPHWMLVRTPRQQEGILRVRFFPPFSSSLMNKNTFVLSF